jgi:ATP-dependent helicase/nuclease subunit A
MSEPQAAYRIDGALVAPEAFYRAACDPRRSVVVEACAGAGKTWMLVSRIVRALLDGAEPQQILAITFTRKAAGEMRERLNQWLAEFAQADPAQRIAELRLRGCTAAEAEALAPALGALDERLLAHGRAVEIRTFHGWFSQLLRAAPLGALEALGLSPDPDLLEERDDLRADYTRRFLAAVADDPAACEDHAALVREHGRHRVEQWIESALDQRTEIERAAAAGTLAGSVPPAAALWPAFDGLATPAAALREPGLAALLAQLARDFAASGKAKQLTAAEGIAAGLHMGDDRDAFEAVWSALHTDKDAPRKQLGDRPEQALACEHLARIRDAIDQHDAHLTHARLVRLVPHLFAAYAAAKRARGLADMIDLEACAERLLADAACSGWIQQRLDARVRHLLVDEFQDTSPLQWRTLDAWLSGYAGAGGGASGQAPPSVFIVGDPKQSIYRFRRADPRVFAQARDFVVQGLAGAHLACDHTRRNAPAVLTALNAVFERAQAQAAFDGFRAHTTSEHALAGAVALRPPVLRPERRKSNDADGADAPAPWRDSLATPRVEAEEALRLVEARGVAAEIAALVADGWKPRHMMVLCRRREPLAAVAQALRERGITHAAPEQRELLAAPEVRDLVALLDALASPRHDLSLAQALRSPIFGADDADLAALVLAARGSATPGWQAALRAGAGAGRAALDRARALLPAWAEAATRLPPHDLLDRIVAEGELRERYAAAVPASGRAAALAAIDALLEQALKLDGGRYATPYGLVRALKKRAVRLPPPGQDEGDGDGAVQLLTIHGAKGLEARAVFVVDAMARPARPAQGTLLIDWPADALAPRCCAFIESDSEARCPPSLRALRAEDLAGAAREELNGLYVAMTRAKERLVVSATTPYPAPPAESVWQRLADAGVAPGPAEAAALAAPVTPAATIVLPMLPRVEAAAARPAAAQPTNAEATRDEAAARLGRAVHRVLEWLPTTPVALERACAAAAQEFGLAGDAAPRIAAIASAVLTSADCRRFFDPAQIAWAGNEVTIVWRGETLRIDRLVALRGAGEEGGGREWWVLDYKLQHAPAEVAAYRAQLAGYREAVASLQAGERVRAGLVTGRGEFIEVGE